MACEVATLKVSVSIAVAEESSYSVRPGTAFRTKGAVAIAFMLFGTSYLFITSHLTAHMDKVKERVQDVKRIMRALDLPKILPIRHKSKGQFGKMFTSTNSCLLALSYCNFIFGLPEQVRYKP